MTQQQPEYINNALSGILRKNVAEESWTWLHDQANNFSRLNSAFVATPRKTGKRIVQLSNEQELEIKSARPGLDISGWGTDRLARVWLLLNQDASDKVIYFRSIESLFGAAEVSELVALYSSLPVLAYPEMWAARCSEGIRSNIGDVLTAIMCSNPYPSENLDEAAWNQLVLKAFFTEKPVHRIIGIDSRLNKQLAATLSDYAHERWAAGRSVNPQLWRCIGKYIDQDLFSDIEKLAASGNRTEEEAAALACSESNYPPARELLGRNKRIQSAIGSGELTWTILAEKTSDYVLQQ